MGSTNDTTKSKYRFVFDQNKCVGCHACVVACSIENGTENPMAWRTISTSNLVRQPEIPLFHFSLACNHCEDAVCMHNCPALAYRRDPETGAVMLNSDACIGCQYCTWVCPYDAPKFNRASGTTEKCTFCNHRINDGKEPACTSLCPTGALGFEKKTLTQHLTAPGFLDFELMPSLRIVSLRKEYENGPELAEKTDLDLLTGLNAEPSTKEKITPQAEWPLVMFTVGVPFLVAWFLSHDFLRWGWKSYVFLGLIVVLSVLSALHLGRKDRIYRAVFNIRRSWLSREILGFGMFTSFSLLYIFVEQNVLLFVLAGLSGVVSITSVDMLYTKILPKRNVLVHSASANSIFLLLLTFLMGKPILWGSILLWKAVSLFYRLYINGFNRLAIVRLGFILITLPAYFFTKEVTWSLLLVLLSEAVDRIMFYQELDVSSPQKVMNRFSGAFIKN